MPKGPNGQIRPADTAQCAFKVFQVAVGEETDDMSPGRRRSGLAGSKARMVALTGEERSEIAKVAASARWK